MAQFYVGPNGGHPPHPGEKVTADTAQEAVIAYQTAHTVSPNITLWVAPVEAVEFFKTGGVTAITPPAYT
jgi:hypothetical protein